MDRMSELSDYAKQMISLYKRESTIKGKKIIDEFKKRNIPFSQAFFDFQDIYGGINYTVIGGLFNDDGFVLDIFHSFNYVHNYNGHNLVQCIYYYSNSYITELIGDDGKIYKFDGEYSIIANNINEFLENKAIEYYLLNIQKQWLTISFYESELLEWLENKELGIVKIEKASGEYSKWWKISDNSIFLNCTYEDEEIYCGTAYIANSHALNKLNTKETSGIGFPIDVVYDLEKKYARICNPREQYCFDGKKYHTGDFSYINALPVNEPMDVYLYLSGKKDFTVMHPIEEFFKVFSSMVTNNTDFDNDIINYAAAHNDENILKVIKYISEMNDKNINDRTTLESDIDMILIGEYIRRLLLFTDSKSKKVHNPFFYFNADELTGINEEVDIEKIFPKINDIKEYSYAKNFSIICLKYIKLAQDGNKIAESFYKIFEPLLLFFALGGYFQREHGYFSIGAYTASFHDWASMAGKEAIDIYKEIPIAWSLRNFNSAVKSIDRIRWNSWSGLDKIIRHPHSKNIKLQSFMNKLIGKKNEDYSILYLARKFGGKQINNVEELCPNLKAIRGTLARYVCESYLEWAVLIDNKNNEALKNPCMYDPFIEMFISDGGEHKDLHESTFNMIEIMKNRPMISI